jgi:hypothetical protein
MTRLEFLMLKVASSKRSLVSPKYKSIAPEVLGAYYLASLPAYHLKFGPAGSVTALGGALGAYIGGKHFDKHPYIGSFGGGIVGSIPGAILAARKAIKYEPELSDKELEVTAKRITDLLKRRGLRKFIK